MSTTTPTSTLPPIRSYHPLHTTFPYTSADLTPSDPSPDTAFYDTPRYVTHIDDHAIASLRDYYSTALPVRGRILDLCSSWVSHFPPCVEAAASKGELQIVGVGMSADELRMNDALHGRWKVLDLNASPALPGLSELFAQADGTTPAPSSEVDDVKELDATTCVVSIDYLTSPVGVLKATLDLTREGGTVHLVISNRCFPTKAVGRWLRISEEERLQMVGDYLWFAGWRDVEIVTLSDGRIEEEAGAGIKDGGAMGMSAFMRMLGMSANACDPLWVVRAKKPAA